MSKSNRQLIPVEIIERSIYFIRNQKVMLSADLAQLYGVEPRVLVQAVKRNRERFPLDFMFQLTSSEFKILKSQTVISSWGDLRRATPYAFQFKVVFEAIRALMELAPLPPKRSMGF